MNYSLRQEEAEVGIHLHQEETERRIIKGTRLDFAQSSSYSEGDSLFNPISYSGDDALMSATSDVTEGLRRTLQLLQSEVDRSLVSNELLGTHSRSAPRSCFNSIRSDRNR